MKKTCNFQRITKNYIFKINKWDTWTWYDFLFFSVFEWSLFYRDLPQYGHKQWQSYFGRTFDVYTKLWKFQQQHRLFTSPTTFFFVPVESKQVMPCFELEEVVIVCQTNRFVLLFYSLLLSLICSNLLIGRFWTVVMAWRDGRLGRWHPKLDSFTTTTSKSNYSFTTLPIMWFHCLVDARFSIFFMQNSIRFFFLNAKTTHLSLSKLSDWEFGNSGR